MVDRFLGPCGALPRPHTHPTPTPTHEPTQTHSQTHPPTHTPPAAGLAAEVAAPATPARVVEQRAKETEEQHRADMDRLAGVRARLA